MYGTVARLHVRPGAEDQLDQLQQEFGALHVPGFIAAYVYRTDVNAHEYYLTVIFDSKESYMANAESPEQDARYRQMRALFEDDPDWHDGDIVSFTIVSQ
ncbi:MAG: antibiotic biosynthesis monooxygenase [Ktedonobacterales bacterium]